MRTLNASSRPIPSMLAAPVFAALVAAAGGASAQSVSWYAAPAGNGQYVRMGGVSPEGDCFSARACCNSANDRPWAYLYTPGTGYTAIATATNTGPVTVVAAQGVSYGGQHALYSISTFLTSCACTGYTSSRYPSPDLGLLPGAPQVNAIASFMSGDGSVIVGSGITPDGYRAFRWTQAGGMVSLGTLPGDVVSGVAGISEDGQVIVGTSAVAGHGRAFRWTQATGMVVIADVPITGIQQLIGSAESLVFTGYTVVGGHNIPFRWAPGSGLVQNLPMIPGRPDATPTGISADGSKIVGYCGTLSGGGAFLWTQATGTVDLQTYLQSHGVDFGPPGQYLVEADSISFDGLSIGGTGGTNADRRLWIVHLPGQTHCGSADFNCDGDTGTDADIDSFFQCLGGVCPAAPCTNSADFNGDGDVGTDADIEAFFRVLSGGTC